MYFVEKTKLPLPLFRYDSQFCSSCSRIMHDHYTVLDWVYTTHGYRLKSLNQPFLSRDCLESYAIAIARKGAPLRNSFGFVDGTVRQICRPGKNQRMVYNGQKRVHALAFQAVARL